MELFFLLSTYSATPFQNVNTNSSSELFNSNNTILDRVAVERARIRMEFFATYDVMTGVRIAATLGGFFGLMVFLVVYKSRGESQETLKALKVITNDMQFFYVYGNKTAWTNYILSLQRTQK